MDNPTRRLDVTFSIFQLGGEKKKKGKKGREREKIGIKFQNA